MGLFDAFPLSNAYSVNLDWIIKKICELEEYVKNYTAVNNVAYAGIWDITEQYTRWAIVTFKDYEYLAKQPVPAGVPLTNKDYWILLADLDPRIAGIIQQLAGITQQLAGITQQLAMLPTSVNGRLLTVNKNGGAMYTTISNALTEAKKIATKNDRVTICIYGGEYTEQIELLDNPGIDIVGIGNVIIRGTKAYPASTLHTTGDGNFANLSFESVDKENYALHIEAQESANPGTRIRFVNCRFHSNDHNAIGIGTGSDYGVEFISCSFTTDANSHYAVYAHNYPQGGFYPSFIRFANCYITNTVGGKCWRFENARKIYDPQGETSPLYLYLTGNYSRIGGVSVYDGTNDIPYLPQNGEVNGENSTGNNDDVNKVAPYVFDAYVAGAANAVFSIPVEMCKKYFVLSGVSITDIATQGAVGISATGVRDGVVDIVTTGITANTVYKVQFTLTRP